MKKILFASILGFSLIANGAFAKNVCDWHDMDKVHKHDVEAINEMGRARAANHYDMAGHGIKAEDLLKQAERELGAAIEAAKRDGNGDCGKK